MKNDERPDQLNRSLYNMPDLSPKTKELCQYGGWAGVLFAVISIGHVMSAAPFSWIIIVLITPNLAAGVSFFLLATTYRHVLICLNITLVIFVFYFILIVYLIVNLVLVFSPSTLLLFLYCLAWVIYGYITDLPWKLKAHYLQKQEDAEYWQGKL